MRFRLAFLLLFVATALARPPAAVAAEPFRDVFRKYLEMRMLEQELVLAEYRNDLTPEEQTAWKLKTVQKLAAKKAEFQQLRQNLKDLSPWEQSVISRIGKRGDRGTASVVSPSADDKETIDSLWRLFPDAERLSALEWLGIREWFGEHAQESFLRIAYSMVPLPPAAAAAKKPLILVVEDPFYRIAVSSGESVFAPIASYYQSGDAKALVKQLKAAGYDADTLELSAFTKLDEQADELHRTIAFRLQKSFLLVSLGEGSAIVGKALDLHPELRKSPHLLGWINAGGRLYGFSPPTSLSSPKKTRMPASHPLGRIENEALMELYRLHREALLRPTPYGPGFPIWNLMSFDPRHRSAPNPRESLVREGKTFFLDRGPAASGVPRIVPTAAEALSESPKP